VRLAKATLIVTAILAVLIPVMAGVAVVTLAAGRIYLGISLLSLGSCLTIPGGVHLARTGRPLLGWWRSQKAAEPPDPKTSRFIGRMNVVVGVMAALNGLVQIGAATRSVVAAVTARSIAAAACGLTTWLMSRSVRAHQSM
jgi:hypothetical protein